MFMPTATAVVMFSSTTRGRTASSVGGVGKEECDDALEGPKRDVAK